MMVLLNILYNLYILLISENKTSGRNDRCSSRAFIYTFGIFTDRFERQYELFGLGCLGGFGLSLHLSTGSVVLFHDLVALFIDELVAEG